jgi:hypothetical protein
MRKLNSSFTIIIFSIAIFFVAATVDASSASKLCIGPIPNPNSVDTGLGNPEGGSRSFKFSVQVDDGKTIDLPFNRRFLYPKLELGIKHLVKIRYEDEIIESFWFKFEAYKSADVCLAAVLGSGHSN